LPTAKSNVWAAIVPFERCGGDFRYYPERRHFLALQYPSKRAKNPTSRFHLGPRKKKEATI